MVTATRSPYSLWSAFDDLLDIENAMGRAVGGGRSSRFPALNAWVTESGVVVDAEVPGVDAGSIDVSVVKDELTLSGQRAADDVGDGVYHRRERGYGKFSRTVQLPFRVQADKVVATYRNGVLRVELPRAEADKPKRITIQAH